MLTAAEVHPGNGSVDGYSTTKLVGKAMKLIFLLGKVCSFARRAYFNGISRF